MEEGWSHDHHPRYHILLRLPWPPHRDGWRSRFYEKRTYDNLDRVTRVDRHDTTSGGNLIARSEMKYDDRGRVYQSVRYGVDPRTGTVGNSLTDNSWFDDAGNAIKQQPAGSKLFTKTQCDSDAIPQPSLGPRQTRE